MWTSYRDWKSIKKDLWAADWFECFQQFIKLMASKEASQPNAALTDLHRKWCVVNVGRYDLKLNTYPTRSERKCSSLERKIIFHFELFVFRKSTSVGRQTVTPKGNFLSCYGKIFLLYISKSIWSWLMKTKRFCFHKDFLAFDFDNWIELNHFACYEFIEHGSSNEFKERESKLMMRTL